MATPLINGTSYAWGQVTLTMLGTPFTGIRKITFKSSQEKVNNYGIGSEPVSRGRGRKYYEGSITFLAEEWKNIIAASPNKEPLDVAPFTISIKWIDINGLLQECKLLFVEFTEHGYDMSEGDTMVEVEVPLIIGKIETPVVI